jgi:hypothetical protein
VRLEIDPRDLATRRGNDTVTSIEAKIAGLIFNAQDWIRATIREEIARAAMVAKAKARYATTPAAPPSAMPTWGQVREIVRNSYGNRDDAASEVLALFAQHGERIERTLAETTRSHDALLETARLAEEENSRLRERVAEMEKDNARLLKWNAMLRDACKNAGTYYAKSCIEDDPEMMFDAGLDVAREEMTAATERAEKAEANLQRANADFEKARTGIRAPPPSASAGTRGEISDEELAEALLDARCELCRCPTPDWIYLDDQKRDELLSYARRAKELLSPPQPNKVGSST